MGISEGLSCLLKPIINEGFKVFVHTRIPSLSTTIKNGETESLFISSKVAGTTDITLPASKPTS